MIIEESFDAEKFCEFLQAVIKDAGKKVFLILDNLRVHHSKIVKVWVAERKGTQRVKPRVSWGRWSAQSSCCCSIACSSVNGLSHVQCFPHMFECLQGAPTPSFDKLKISVMLLGAG